nr:hypothetical protein [Tanacetum cinerariifolium]
MVIIVKDVLFSVRNLRKIFLHLEMNMEFSKILSSQTMTIPTLLMLLESHSLEIKTWNGANYGYNCPPKVPIILNQEPFNNQTIKELPPTVQSFDPNSDLVYDSPNIFDPPSQLPFYSCEFYGNDTRYGHYCIPQVSFVYPEPCYNQDFNFPQDFHDFQQQYVVKITGLLMKLTNVNQGMKTIIMSKILAIILILLVLINFNPSNIPSIILEEEKQIKEDQAANARYWKIPACYDDDDDDYAFAITPNEPENSLMSLRVKNECDVPAYEEFTTFSNILFEVEYDFYSSDDQSFSDEDLPKEIYSNPLFDEEIILMKIDPHHYNAKSDLIESLRNHDSSIISSSNIDSLFDEFAGELILLKSIPSRIDETGCYPEEETHFVKTLLYDNSSPRPPEEFVSKNSDAAIESFSPSPIPVEDSDSLMEEIDLSFTPDYPMPPGIEDDNYDTERDVLILDELLSNDSLSFPKKESFHFDIPSFSRPPTKPPDGNT